MTILSTKTKTNRSFDTISQRIFVSDKKYYSKNDGISTETATALLSEVLSPSPTISAFPGKALTYIFEIVCILGIFLIIQLLNPVRW